MNISQVVSIKIFYRDEIRRLSIAQPYPSWEQFFKSVSTLFNLSLPIDKFRLYYEDEEKDRITVNSDLEWQATLSVLSSQSLSKVYLHDFPQGSTTSRQSPGKSDNDMNIDDKGPPQPTQDRIGCRYRMNRLNDLDRYINNCNNMSGNTRHMSFHENRGMCPRFNKKEFKMRRKQFHGMRKGRKLERKMHKRALLELKTENYAVAAKLLEALLSLNPTDYSAFYNLACCEALSGNTDSALTHLSLAVENGFHDVQLLESDSDLANLRTHPQFNEIANGLTERLQATFDKLSLDDTPPRFQ